MQMIENEWSNYKAYNYLVMPMTYCFYSSSSSDPKIKMEINSSVCIFWRPAHNHIGPSELE